MKLLTLYYDEPIVLKRAVDIALPDQLQQDTALFYIHGGGWGGGARDIFHYQLEYFSQQGFLCASAGYRLAPAAKMNEQLTDASAGYQRFWQYIHEQELPIRQVIVIGSSAGAHLAALLCLRQDLPHNMPQLHRSAAAQHTPPSSVSPSSTTASSTSSSSAPARSTLSSSAASTDSSHQAAEKTLSHQALLDGFTAPPPAACIFLNGPGTLEPWPNMNGDIRRSIESALGMSYDDYDANPEKFREVSPLSLVGPHVPDMWFIVVGLEQFFPHEHVYELSERVREVHSKSEVVLIAEAEHGFLYGVHSRQQKQGLQVMKQWISQYTKKLHEITSHS
ncbi:alpha/beta hydrolase [Paenibacillus chungangensis]|uniref:Alpha/beta hydrolase n=1 Tax=Paenibacillus chungangensis TaxID=696535 RepID=A0ABW3HSV6_9BACL